MRSKSRGYVKAKSGDVSQGPEIFFNYLSHPEDLPDWRKCLRLTREIIAQPAFDDFRGDEIQPGKHCQTDDELDDFVRQHCESAYHPCGTCKMGEGNPMDVVDSKLRVHGLQNLRVVDSSIMPRITNGNLNVPSIMIGEKGADLILDKELPPANVVPHQDPKWQERQRPRDPVRKHLI
jgi:choline dehydrogenase